MWNLTPLIYTWAKQEQGWKIQMKICLPDWQWFVLTTNRNIKSKIDKSLIFHSIFLPLKDWWESSTSNCDDLSNTDLNVGDARHSLYIIKKLVNWMCGLHQTTSAAFSGLVSGMRVQHYFSTSSGGLCVRLISTKMLGLFFSEIVTWDKGTCERVKRNNCGVENDQAEVTWQAVWNYLTYIKIGFQIWFERFSIEQ